MNKIVPALLGCALTITTLSTAFASQGPETQKDKLSYTIGLQMGMQLATIKEKVDLEKVIKAIREGQSETKPQLSEDEMRAVMASFQEEMKAEQQAQAVLQASINTEAAKTFLTENASKEGVITLDSGLQYKVITKGSGASPAATDTVRVHYRGSLINGHEFDSSFKRGEPVEFPVNRVIAGWTEALQLMKEGSKWQLFIPADLAYGERGSGNAMIGPNTMLIFEVELLEVKKEE